MEHSALEINQVLVIGSIDGKQSFKLHLETNWYPGQIHKIGVM